MGDFFKKIKAHLMWFFGGVLLGFIFVKKNKREGLPVKNIDAALKAKKEKEAEIEKTDPFDLLADSSSLKSHSLTTDRIKSDLRDRIGKKLQRKGSSSDN